MLETEVAFNWDLGPCSGNNLLNARFGCVLSLTFLWCGFLSELKHVRQIWPKLPYLFPLYIISNKFSELRWYKFIKFTSINAKFQIGVDWYEVDPHESNILIINIKNHPYSNVSRTWNETRDSNKIFYGLIACGN